MSKKVQVFSFGAYIHPEIGHIQKIGSAMSNFPADSYKKFSSNRLFWTL